MCGGVLILIAKESSDIHFKVTRKLIEFESQTMYIALVFYLRFGGLHHQNKIAISKKKYGRK